MSNIVRRPLRYYGGKWLLAPWIISYFPPHNHYIEPCGGGASILLRKEKSNIETYNDINEEVVNFFRVLRDMRPQLQSKLSLTPWARREFELSLNGGGDSVERARRFFVRSWQSFSAESVLRDSNWRKSVGTRRSDVPLYRKVIQDLDIISDRLMDVQIECATARKVIESCDGENSLIYFDPPYIHSSRVKLESYANEPDDNWHEEMASVLNNISGYAIVSGYPSELYKRLYEDNGWHREDKVIMTNVKTARTESIWLNEKLMRDRPRQLSLL